MLRARPAALLGRTVDGVATSSSGARHASILPCSGMKTGSGHSSTRVPQGPNRRTLKSSSSWRSGSLTGRQKLRRTCSTWPPLFQLVPEPDSRGAASRLEAQASSSFPSAEQKDMAGAGAEAQGQGSQHGTPQGDMHESDAMEDQQQQQQQEQQEQEQEQQEQEQEQQEQEHEKSSDKVSAPPAWLPTALHFLFRKTSPLRLPALAAAGAALLLLLLLLGTRLVAALSSGPHRYRAWLAFPNACGITVGTPVRVRGAEVGTVVGVRPSLESVEAEVEIQDDTFVIPLASSLVVNQSGLVGETLIDITPPLPIPRHSYGPRAVAGCRREGVIVCHGDRVRGRQGVSVDELVGLWVRLGRASEHEKAKRAGKQSL